MKVLVLSGVTAGSGNVGGVILKELFGQTNSSCFTCYSLGQAANADGKQLQNCTLHVRSFANARARRSWSGRSGAIASIFQYVSSFRPELKALVKEVAACGAAAGVERVFQVMDTSPLIALGTDVADNLGVPLYSLVWDPPDYVLRTQGWDRFSKRCMHKGFRRALARSRRVAVVSNEMAEEYRRLGAQECVILRHGHARARLRDAQPRPRPGESFVIGFAGNMYSVSAWGGFVAALDLLGWKVAGRPVTVRLLGAHYRLKLNSPSRVECLGWRDNDETLSLLAECDLNYLPYPFESGLVDLARLSFPTKLSTYAAAGVPVFVHAPEYASLNAFYRDYPLGEFCSSLEPQVIAAALQGLVADGVRMRGAAEQAVRAARNELNREVFLSRFAEFLDLPSAGGPGS